MPLPRSLANCFPGLALSSLLALVACKAHQPQPPFMFSTRVSAPPEHVLAVATTQLTERGYYAFRGNAGTVVASASESTFWTGPSVVAGAALMPLALVTWPVAATLDTSQNHEATMWWPTRAFTWETTTYRDTAIYLLAVSDVRGSRVTIEIVSPTIKAKRHAMQVLEALAMSGFSEPPLW